ncbi:MAG TPA: tRNA pseudouridine(55) synthase TruB [Woeseiaceae bacterium]|nr:tRNA pseudouridine(55) synthase TruB [Woeseiaceae bacterium]
MNKPGTSRSQAVDGILLLNKSRGLSSNQALQRIKRLLNAKKAGHTGSLDPAATGMLPLCFGDATKVCAFLLNADKTYRVTAKLGVRTDTGDAEGNETGTATVPELGPGDWDALLQGFLGESMQIPPMYSALKKDGKRLYELARKGISVEREPRPIRVSEIELLEYAGHRLVFRVRCSKGTYIRTLVEDLAEKAGTVAHTSHLHRESVGHFDCADMLTYEDAEALAADSRDALVHRLLAPDAALAEMPGIILDGESEQRFREGMAVRTPSAVQQGLVRVYGPDGDGDFVGVGEVTDGSNIAPKRVFQRQ